MEFLCNIFNGVYDLDCLNVVKLDSVLSAIKNGRWKDKIEHLRTLTDKEAIRIEKNKLPCVTFCGVFEVDRKDECCVHYNSLMIVDVDKISETRLKSLKKELMQNKYVYAFFESPNKGLKILIPIDSPLAKHNTDAFFCVEEMFRDMYNINIDKSGKNVSRLCFVSFDADTYINKDCFIFQVEEKFSTEGFQTIVSSHESFIPSTDADYIFDVCRKMVKKSKTGGYHKGNRNNYIFSLSCLMCEFGVNYDQSLYLVAGKYSSLEFKEVRSTVASAFRKNKSKFATKIINQRTNSKQVNIEL